LPEGVSTTLEVGIQQSIPSESEKKRARDLNRHKSCPHCCGKISLADAISMVQGDGYATSVLVETESGSVVLPVADVNPQTMRIIER
jgi:hypothetical protein